MTLNFNLATLRSGSNCAMTIQKSRSIVVFSVAWRQGHRCRNRTDLPLAMAWALYKRNTLTGTSLCYHLQMFFERALISRLIPFHAIFSLKKSYQSPKSHQAEVSTLFAEDPLELSDISVHIIYAVEHPWRRPGSDHSVAIVYLNIFTGKDIPGKKRFTSEREGTCPID